jgi:hypothetical protein
MMLLISLRLLVLSFTIPFSSDDQRAFSEDLEQLAEDYDPSEEGNNISENQKEGMRCYHKKGKSRILKNTRQLKGNDGSGSELDSE